MKRNNFQRIFFLCLIMLCAGALMFGCKGRHGGKNKQEDIFVLHTFANSNWTYEEQVLDLPFQITDTGSYRIEFTLNYDSTVNVLTELPITVTLTYPDGMDTYVTSIFDFNPKNNKAIQPTGNGSECNMTLVAFPKKQLNQAGEYHISFYRKTQKYDNYGLNSLSMRVLPVK